ncbi:Nn.00g009840.m01.CDS01 [Neocucurbitaria sp. VM-36]
MAARKQVTSPFQVFVRWRPLPISDSTTSKLQHETTKQDSKVSISISPQSNSGRPETWKSGAAFTHVFEETDDNRDVFEKVVAPFLPHVLNGATCNFFAYGHSGSGKTHTIIGYDYEDESRLGLCLAAARDIFQSLDAINKKNIDSNIDGTSEDEELSLAIRLYEVRGKCADSVGVFYRLRP